MVVFFDPEGLLTDAGACRFYAWQEMAREQGIIYDQALDEQLQGLDEASHIAGILRRARRSYSPAERMALITRQEDLCDQEMQRLGDGVLRNGAERILNSLKKRDVRLAAVMTDGLPGQVLGYTSISRQFEAIARQGDMLSQLSETQLRLSAAPAECLLVTIHPLAARDARSLGMQALLCGKGDDLDAVLQQILSVIPDFKNANQRYGGNYAG